MPSKLPEEIIAYGKAHKKAYSALLSAIKRYDKIVVFRHLKPDFDAFGSQLGLAQFLKDNFPEKEIHFVGDSHPSFTGRIFPEMEDLKNEWFTGRDFLAIVIDVGDPDRIADPRFKKAKYKAKIDHHPCKEEVAPKCTICDLDAAAAAEMVADFCLNCKGLKMSKEAAKWFYIGIVGDSGRFLYSSTSTHTFAVAQELLRTGIDIHAIYLNMYEKTIQSLYNQAYVLGHFSLTPHGVAYYCLDKQIQEELKITPILGKENVNLFANIAGIPAWCSITEDPNPKDYCWRISIRSKDKDISGVAQKWGGGGHAQASGAKIKDLTELDAFLKDMDDLFAE